MRTASVLMIAFGLLALVQASCSKGEPKNPTFPVTGKVLVRGKPAEHATVVFHPVNDTDAAARRPQGKVGADGTFTLTTYEANDGAPAGEYRVTLQLWLASRNPEEPPSNRLPVAYSNPVTSGLKAKVDETPTELKTFEIK